MMKNTQIQSKTQINKPITIEKQRLDAIGQFDEFKDDQLIQYICKESEKIFTPMSIQSKNDWLYENKETGQTYKRYKQGGPNMQWVNPRMKTIYLCIIDDSIEKEKVQKLNLYCQAFYTGMIVKMLNIKDNKGDSFLKNNKIESRVQYGQLQYNASDILSSLKDIKPKDAFCVLGMTNVDLYPREESNFVFGLASGEYATGIFSFCRLDPLFQDFDDPQRNHHWLMLSCYVMVHEIAHTFGLKHCIYYKCTMNGSNSYEESKRRSSSILCPICTKKLKLNIKFDTTTRYQNLIHACEQLNFENEARIYSQILNNNII